MTHARDDEGWPVQTRPASVDLPLWALLLGWLLGRFGRLVGWLVTHPAFTLPALAAVAVMKLADAAGGWVIPAALTVAIGACGWWRHHWPQTFTRHVTARAHGGLRSALYYRPGWHDTIDATGLAVTVRGERRRPKLLRVAATGSVDTVTIRPTTGQVADDYTAVADRLAASFEALDCRILPGRMRDQLRLRFLITDPLTDPGQRR